MLSNKALRMLNEAVKTFDIHVEDTIGGDRDIYTGVPGSNFEEACKTLAKKLGYKWMPQQKRKSENIFYAVHPGGLPLVSMGLKWQE